MKEAGRSPRAAVATPVVAEGSTLMAQRGAGSGLSRKPSIALPKASGSSSKR